MKTDSMAEEETDVQYHIEIQSGQCDQGEVMVVLDLDGQEMPASVAEAIIQLTQNSSQPLSLLRVTKTGCGQAPVEATEGEMTEYHIFNGDDSSAESIILKAEDEGSHQQFYVPGEDPLSHGIVLHNENIHDNIFPANAVGSNHHQETLSTGESIFHQQSFLECESKEHQNITRLKEEPETLLQLKVEGDDFTLLPADGFHKVKTETDEHASQTVCLADENETADAVPHASNTRIIIKNLAQLEELMTGKVRRTEDYLVNPHFTLEIKSNVPAVEDSLGKTVVQLTDSSGPLSEEKMETSIQCSTHVSDSENNLATTLDSNSKSGITLVSSQSDRNSEEKAMSTQEASWITEDSTANGEVEGESEETAVAVSAKVTATTKYCSLCPFTSDSDLELGRHLKRVHGKAYPFVCSVCQKSFMLELSFQIHSLVHVDTTRSKQTRVRTFIACPHCSQSFSTKRRMLRHVSNEHPDLQAYFCDSCKVSCKTKHEFCEHNLSEAHKDKASKVSVCPVCKVACLRLSRHLTTNHPDYRPFKCDMCGHTCKTKTKMENHQQTHLSTKSFECPHCHKCLKSKISWSRHVKNHSAHKKFSCTQCDYTCNDSYEFKRHVQRVHSKKAYYDCKFCNLSFIKASDLKFHAMSEHKSRDSHFCCYCDFSCETRAEMKKHRQTHTGANPFICDHCGFSTAIKAHLERHQATHTDLRPFKCPECDYCCKEKVNLQKHMITHRPDRPIACSMCSYRCKQQSLLNSHVRIVHSSLRPYACKVCSYTCKTASNLKKHLWIHEGYKPHACRFCSYVARERNKLRRHEKFIHKIGVEEELPPLPPPAQEERETTESPQQQQGEHSTQPFLENGISPQQNFEPGKEIYRGIFKRTKAINSTGEYEMATSIESPIFSGRVSLSQLEGNTSGTEPLTLSVQMPQHQSFIIL